MPAIDTFADLIEPFSRRGVDLGLERMRSALAELGHPERRFPAVQVAGTNGKGSICTLVHAALLASGLRAGLYTSPHLVSWCERIQLGDGPIDAQELRQLLSDLQPLARRHDLTPFELVTLAAFQAFAEAGLDLVVLEVGLGGRLDATTVHPERQVLGFAAIGMDHSEVLGSTIAAIAAEKAGIFTPGSLAVSGPQQPEAAAVLHQRALESCSDLHWVEPLAMAEGDLVAGQLRWRSGLPGLVQRHNAAVALGLVRALRQRGWRIPDQAIVEGFERARWPARLQRVRWQGQPLLLDGAHNLPAAEALRQELDQGGAAQGGRCWLLGVLANKPAPEMLRALLAAGDRAWLVPVPEHPCWSLEPLLEAAPELTGRLRASPSVAEGLAAAATGAGGQTVVVAGSLYLIGALIRSGTLQDPQRSGGEWRENPTAAP
ncbi:folylpolyglutamate synthase/dihydrofolate synthase family protein [Synechococcus sp. CS-205]|uniref:bifunctional folylpolyglutamate synthase/dihydrofolate synthase n=1 Tax=Synechococcus sp. CS-205 TaxID=2847984 RepID=UPI00223BEA12|nr:Mur ligase family protein [Synechococcus sp. CS-205]MCT0248263.1 bifunctional folylpolyglutamate synthase/dihydrofolate synthase [Synechococcus sp. CS-205]